MKRDLAAIAARQWDLAIVGGGIYGVCAAWEAARRGLAVCLLERDDFGGATSSQSLKVIHGGLRYLQHAHLPRFFEAVSERRRFLELAPHLVSPIPFVMPTHGRALRSREAMAIALLANDVLGLRRSPRGDPKKRIPRGRVLWRAEALELLPGLAGAGITGAARWWDCQSYSTERLLLALLAAATSAGAAAANRAEVVEPIGTAHRVEGVRVRDTESGAAHAIHARVVLNAAGPWADSLLARLVARPAPPRFLASKAFNLVTRRLRPEAAVGLEGREELRDRDAVVPAGRRLFFVVPWHDLSLIGTRHLPWRGDPDEFRITRDDVRLFVDEVNAAYPPFAVRRDDVIGVYGGMLPQSAASLGADEVELEKRSRVIDHAREEPVEGLITLIGVKWTAARAVAARGVTLACRKLGRPQAMPSLRGVRLPGSEFERHEEFLDEQRASLPACLDAASGEHLLRSFGTRARDLFALAEQRPELATVLQEGSWVIGAEVVRAVREEMALHLDDVLLRRTELSLASPLDDAAIERTARLMAAELDWDAPRIDAELARAHAALARFRVD
ncbi:MAG: glycerol-3-phosphate dehydrogenase/oxidase [Deltaproteobacteria bacterium]|nr:glycerol-3-phosphate dehydrogenase/oxidase [Deltaproteobacteria bacterium]